MRKTPQGVNVIIWLTLYALLGLGGVGCSVFSHREVAGVPTLKEVQAFRVTDPEPPAVVDPELESMSAEMNPLVEKWINYFQGKGRPHMERYLARSTRYSKLMKLILRQNGLPEDLIYVALIESGFSPKATSHASAVGYWQFIRGTGRRYGLEINSFVDERRDPVLSTQAAAEYFKGLYSMFGSWYLALASYNSGENRVKRVVMKHYTRDFWEIARKRKLPRETINYIPKFIAAKMIGRNPEAYGFTDILYEDPIEFELIKVDHPVNLRTMAANMGMEYEEFKRLNPRFRGEIAPAKGNDLELRVPLGQTEVALAAANKAVPEKIEFVADSGETDIYRVRRGDSLYLIARRYRTTVAWLRDTNDIKKGKKLRIGMRLQVPDRGVTRKVATTKPAKIAQVERSDKEKADSNPEIFTPKGVYYVVQAGDTLWEIAGEYDTTVRGLMKLNKMGRRSMIRPGMKLLVPKDSRLPSEPSTDEGSSIVKKEQSSQQRSVSSVKRVSHVVRRGENLSYIAKKYGVSLSQLRKVNQLNRRAILRVGVRLVIPADGQG